MDKWWLLPLLCAFSSQCALTPCSDHLSLSVCCPCHALWSDLWLPSITLYSCLLTRAAFQPCLSLQHYFSFFIYSHLNQRHEKVSHVHPQSSLLGITLCCFLTLSAQFSLPALFFFPSSLLSWSVGCHHRRLLVRFTSVNVRVEEKVTPAGLSAASSCVRDTETVLVCLLCVCVTSGMSLLDWSTLSFWLCVCVSVRVCANHVSFGLWGLFVGWLVKGRGRETIWAG